MTAETPAKDRTGWHAARERARSQMERYAARRADLWLQGERIRRYLPTLHRQRDEAAERLADLDQLIRDEERAAEEIRARFN